MSNSNFAVCYGVQINRHTAYNILKSIENSDTSIEDLLGIEINSDQIFDLTIEEFSMLLEDFGAKCLYTSHIRDEPAFIGIQFENLIEGSLTKQYLDFSNSIVGCNDPYINHPLKEFLPSPELLIISYYD